MRKITNILLFLIFICNLSYAYYVEEDGKKITVGENVADAVDDIEMKEGEPLTYKQIIAIASSSGSSFKEL